MAKFYKLTKDGSTILPATSTEAIIDPKSNESLADLLHDAFFVNTSVTIEMTDKLNFTFTSELNGKDITEECSYIFGEYELMGNTYSEKVAGDLGVKTKVLQTIYKGRSYELEVPYKVPLKAYYGVISQDDEINEQTVLGLDWMFCSEKKATFRPITMIAQRFVYAYPSVLGELGDIKDINGFDYLSGGSFGLEVVSVNGIDYNVYHLKTQCTIDGANYGFFFY